MVVGIVLVLAMVIGVPVGVMLTGALWSAAFGWVSSDAPEGGDGEVASA